MSRPPALSLLQPLCPECVALTLVQRRMDHRGWGYADTHTKHTKQETYIDLNSTEHTRRGRKKEAGLKICLMEYVTHI